jgi:uncharacterized protein RhaS with RHS repeats
LHYNRFRYYDNGTGQYLTPDPISYIDPLGLISVDDPGHSVYGLYDPGVTDPYYIGITNDVDRRMGEHVESGRLTPGSKMKVLDSNVTYGQS